MPRRATSPAARNILVSRLLTHSGDQAWDFAVPLALVAIWPENMGVVALYYLLVRFFHMVLVTRVLSFLDRWDRMRVIRIGIGTQTGGVIVTAGAMLLLAQRTQIARTLAGEFGMGSPVVFPFLLVAFASLLSSLGASMMDVAVSQDWIPTVVSRDELPLVNSRLKQIDLMTELTAPLLAGLILTVRTSAFPLLGFFGVALWNLVSFFPEYRLLHAAFTQQGALASKMAMVSVQGKQPFWYGWRQGWREFQSQPAAFAMLAYAMLWVTILSPHGVLLAAWLKTQWHLSEPTIGLLRGLGALFGLVSTLLFPLVRRRLSLVATSRVFILGQAFCLLGAGIAFSFGPSSFVYFACFLLLSRIGLYGFSLGETEIRQVTVRPERRGRVNGFAQALTSLATLGVYGAGTALGDPAFFSWLVYGSIVFVALGAVTFSIWSWSKAATTSLSLRVPIL